MDEFRAILTASHITHGWEVNTEFVQTEAFITDAVESITDYVASVGDARINGGWSWA